MKIARTMLGVIAAFLLVGLSGLLPVRAEGAKHTHRIAIQVNGDDPASMNRTLNNMENLYAHYAAAGEPVEIRVIAFGPGLQLLRDDLSPVKDRLVRLKSAHPGLTYAACANTKRSLEKTEGKPVPIVSSAELVPSGVVEIVRLQEKGWTYLRP